MSTSDQPWNMSLIGAIFEPWSFLSSAMSASSSNAEGVCASVASPLGLPLERPPRFEKPPLPPRLEPLPREAPDRVVTSDIMSEVKGYG